MPSVIVCGACDLAHLRDAAPATERTRCARCRAPLQRREVGRIDTSIALAASALGLFFLSNVFPLVAINYNGTRRSTTFLGAALGLYDQGHAALAALVFITTVVGPLLQIASLLYVLIPLRYGRRAPGQNGVFRVLTQIRQWTFVEVFMLGALVALVRLSSYAQVIPGIALWSCALLMLSLAALTTHTSPEQFWRWVEQSRK
jgi:paraquat-inducible protein A